MVTSSDEYDFFTPSAICTEGGYLSCSDMTGHKLNTEQTQEAAMCPHLLSISEYLYTNVGVHFTIPSQVSRAENGTTPQKATAT